MDFDHSPDLFPADWTHDFDALPSSGASSAVAVCRAMIAEHLEVGVEEISPRQHLEKDLGITRLGLVLIGLDLEDLEQVTLPFELLAEIDTVGQLARFLEEARLSTRRLPVAAVHHPAGR